MIEVKLLVDCIDYDSVVDLLMPVVGDKLQAKGGKRMPAPDYFRGHPITIE